MASIRRCPYLRLIPVLASLGLPISVIGIAGTEIVVNRGRYGSYYHLQMELKAEVIDFARSDHLARSGGQFELRLLPQRFPVAAPQCPDAIILRMPWTSPRVHDAKAKIAAKEELLKRLLALRQAPHATLPVVIELNPYVKVISRAPLKLQLTQCNVFFRDNNGAYVDNTKPASAQ